MAGLVPAIHVFLIKQDVDARHKAGHDGLNEWLSPLHVMPCQNFLHGLDQRGLVYTCFCSRSDVARASDGRRDPDGASLYPGTCRALSSAERGARLARGGKAAFRLDMGRALAAAPARLTWA